MQALVDTSVWIDWLRGRETRQTRQLEILLAHGSAWVAPVILQELYQGARDQKQLQKLQMLFSDLLCASHTKASYTQAGTLFAQCRWQGITPRSPHDCLIAATAVEHHLPLLQDDQDFMRLQKCLPQLTFFKTPSSAPPAAHTD